ncbi:hypothetical protein [Pseudarthrobacter sp. NamE5]|uniref:hypothetical protein n=1 Tax=Pseudarthrobacter sp. NamE5 TaxID=2576839 RepID=UPI00110ADF11|nr:hypothetical protein [Pseudarthrobacter sp. NamE5]TLM80829.1 hypothetical protein FDW84_18445 [Pseudarthrobacter sp. NamE5]
MPIRISEIYEECEYLPFPEWTTEEEDKRIFSGESFGQSGDAWATVFVAQLVTEDVIWSTGATPWPLLDSPVMTPIAEQLWLRVCSPTFSESDQRFKLGDRHLAFVQDRFDRVAVEDYFSRRVAEVSNRRVPAAFNTLEQYFHASDPLGDY